MSLYGALFGGVSGLTAQASKIGVISDNIANVNTVGYKQSTATFSSLVVNAASNVSYQTGGVVGGTTDDVSQQGLLESTSSPTDLAISGNGFFVVRAVPNGDVGGTAATPLYTRAGSFTPDALGNFVNTDGFYLQGWPLDREGRLPGAPGNLDTTSSSNFDSLEPVNVASASGVAQGTTTISLGANLKASEVVFPGASGLLVPDLHNTANQSLAADQIQVGSEFGLAGADSMTRGDTFSVQASGSNNVYTYGGFTIGRQVTTANVEPVSSNYGDSGTDNTASDSLSSANSVVFTGGSTFTVTVANPALVTGGTVTLAGFGNVGVTPAGEINGTHTVTRTGTNTFTFTTTTPPGVPAGTDESGAGESVDTRQFKGNMFDADTAAAPFFSLTSTSNYTAAALTMEISTTNGGTQTFTYTANSPDTSEGQFNSLNTLAQAIDATSALTARVVNGRLVVGAADANQAVTFTNGDAVGNTAGTQAGIDWVQELGVSNVAAASTNVSRYSSLQGLANMVNATTTIAAKINNPLNGATMSINVDDPLNTIQFADAPTANTAIAAGGTVTFPNGTVNGTPSSPATMSVTITDTPPPALINGDSIYLQNLPAGFGGLPGLGLDGGPYTVTGVTAGSYTINVPVTSTVTTTNVPISATGAVVSIAGKSNQGSVLASFGFAGTPATATNIAVPSLNSTSYVAVTPGSTPIIGPEYDPTGQVGKNMASGDITAQFSRNVTVYDSLGSAHDLQFSYIKTATNTWAVEVHAVPASDVKDTGSFVDGQVAVGTVQFNGDGTLHDVTGDLLNPIPIQWNNGAIDSSISLDLGTAGQPSGTPGATTVGLSDGLSQFDSPYNVNFANQNGAPVGELTSVSIDKNGIVTASYSNGQSQALFQIPLASFADPDGLDAMSGNVYSETQDSGAVNLRQAGNNGTGTMVSAALEQSNVDLASQLTDIIVAQRAYEANTKVIKTADDLLNELNQL